MEYVDIDKMIYRESTTIMGFEIPGAWYNLPPVDYISIFNAGVKSTFFSRSGEYTNHSKEMQVNFIYDTNKKLTAFVAKNKDEAIAKAKEFAQKLGGIRILDATQKPFVWIED